MKTIIQAISLCLLFLVYSNSAMAQDASKNNTESAQEISTISEQSSAPNDDYEKYDQYKLITQDMENQSKLYKGLGWGFFGTGLAMVAAGIPVMLVYASKYNDEKNKFDNGNRSDMSSSPVDKKYYDVRVNTGSALTSIGILFTLTGIGLLIAEAVKFAPLHKHGIAGDFSWQPHIYASPEMSGIGISTRF